MKAAPFTYHVPGTVAEAIETLAAFGDEAKVLAGGQSLVPMMALRLARVGHLVDLGRIAALKYVRGGGDGVAIGAMTAQAAAERDPVIAASVPLLARAIPFIGHFQIRNRGTVGGSCAHADPAAEIPAVAVTLDADMEAAGPGRSRRIPAAKFFTSTFTTSLEPDEVLTALHFPAWPGRSGFAVREFARRRGDFAVAGALCAVTLGPGMRIERVAIGLLGLGGMPLRAAAAERAATGAAAGDIDVTELGRLAVADTEPPDDIHATGAVRRRVGAAMAAQALAAALEDALEESLEESLEEARRG
jgi:aerobic carbon-monoxide dehydrogenase medium subunit